jgi:hypothetical protein
MWSCVLSPAPSLWPTITSGRPAKTPPLDRPSCVIATILVNPAAVNGILPGSRRSRRAHQGRELLRSRGQRAGDAGHDAGVRQPAGRLESQLRRMGTPSDPLQPVHALARKVMRTYDKGVKCFARAASVSMQGGGVIAGTPDRAKRSTRRWSVALPPRGTATTCSTRPTPRARSGRPSTADELALTERNTVQPGPVPPRGRRVARPASSASCLILGATTPVPGMPREQTVSIRPPAADQPARQDRKRAGGRGGASGGTRTPTGRPTGT